MATQIKRIFAHGLLVEHLLFCIDTRIFLYQIVFVNQRVDFGSEFVGASQQVFREIGMVLLPKDTPALATLTSIEQQTLVIVACRHASDSNLLHNAIQVPLVPTPERDDVRGFQRIVANGALGRLIDKGRFRRHGRLLR